MKDARGWAVALLASLWLTPAVSDAQAQALRSQGSRIRLSELVPALAGTELGALDVGPAPPPGAHRVVYRAEVLRALRRAGRDRRGLAIPRRFRVTRRGRTVGGRELDGLARPAVGRALSPCRVETLTGAGQIRVPQGALEVSAEGQAPRRSGVVPVSLRLSADGFETRLPLRARVSCPPPLVRAGAQVQLLVRRGRVEARAPGIARQHGRVGDTIVVQNTRSRTRVSGRVLDAQTVEVSR